MRVVVLCLFTGLLSSISLSQISFKKGITLEESIKIAEVAVDVKFSYSSSAIPLEKKIEKDFYDITLDVFLQYLYQVHHIKNKTSGSSILLFSANEDRVVYLSGYVRDSLSREPLIFAVVRNTNTGKGVTSNEYGYYVIPIIEDEVELSFSYIGCTTKKIKIASNTDLSRDILLVNNTNLKELNVIDYISNSSYQSPGKVEFTSEALEKVPMLKGENDPLRTMSLLPGVSSDGDDSYLHVRGGNIGENLVLIDGVPIYKMSHFKRLSVVNGDAINKTTLYKSNFPSRYNGRSSSIIDFRIKNGNQEKVEAQGSIGFQTFKMMVEGPLFKNLTFVASGRRNYGAFFDEIVGKPIDYRNFYDLYGKLNYNLPNGNIAISGFFDQDKSYFSDSLVESPVDSSGVTQAFDLSNVSYNGMVSLQWNQQWGKKLFSNHQLSFYDYAIQSTKTIDNEQVNYSNSHIQDIIFNAHYELKREIHHINFGVNSTYHNLFSIFDTDTSYLRENGVFIESSVYVEDQIELTSKIKLRAGINWMIYADRRDLSKLKWLTSIDPRLQADYQFKKDQSFSVSYSKMSQYIHLIPFSLTDNEYQSEIWQASTSAYLPTISNQFSVSYINSIFKQLPFTIEGYIKYQRREKNVQESDLELLFFGIESTAFNGNGTNLGLEFLIEKKGKLSGWLSYSLSRSLKKFEEINNGERYLSSYDRNHLLTIALNYAFTQKISVNATWQLRGGTPFYEKYANQQDIDSNTFTSFNRQKYTNATLEELLEGKNWRYPSYNELSIQCTFTKQKKWGERIWQIGFKNLYTRREYKQHILGLEKSQYSFIYSWKTARFFEDYYPYITFRFKFK